MMSKLRSLQSAWVGLAVALVAVLAGCATRGEATVESSPPAPAASEAPTAPAGAASTTPTSAASTIRLTVTGDAANALIRDVIVTRDTGDAAEDTRVQSLPWETEVQLTDREMDRLIKVVLFAKNTDGVRGELECEISIDGERVAHERTSGREPITCLELAGRSR